jgi:nitric-oxide synthase
VVAGGQVGMQMAVAARSFLSDPELGGDRSARVAAVLREIAGTGTYRHTGRELRCGAQLAWRNHARCIGRLHWQSLAVLDRRDCGTAEEVARACVDHIRHSTNGGAIRPAITVFAQRGRDGAGIRIWNPQLIRYAGYRQPDGSVVGDPATADLTEAAQRLGWRGPGGRFDVLPLVIQMPGRRPEIFQIPPQDVLEVPITHRDYDWFAELGLRWYALPAVSNMALDVGGLTYSAAPFSGWYVDTEIAARDMGDTYRYNMLPQVAAKMGLDTSTTRSLWQDRALVEISQAVIGSFRAAGIRLVDHHLASRQFLTHVAREEHLGRRVPTDWAWVVPPISGSAAPTFHRTFDPPEEATPNFRYQPDPWQHVAPDPACPHAPPPAALAQAT